MLLSLQYVEIYSAVAVLSIFFAHRTKPYLWYRTYIIFLCVGVRTICTTSFQIDMGQEIVLGRTSGGTEHAQIISK